MIIPNKTSSEFILEKGQTLSVTTSGSSIIFQKRLGELSGDPVMVKPTFPITVGPLQIASQWQVDAINGIATVTTEAAGQVCRVVKTTDALLPTYGKTGLIYETESGWLRWDELTGAFVNSSGAPLKPVAVSGTDPVISGDTEIGSVITVIDQGGWTGRPTSYTYQWQIDGFDVVGATSIDYTTTSSAASADVTCDIKGVNIIDTAATASSSNAIGMDAV